ncbi:MAG TPA: diguanylate cyclase [Chloroflexota bacterium]|nr:diguanylate cyclase [Chloroflexota bacterium]
MSTSPSPRPLYRRPVRLALVLLALLICVAVDGTMLALRPTVPQWDVRVDTSGAITWVDPNGPADTAGLHVGDRVLRPRGFATVFDALLAGQTQLLVRHDATTRRVRAAPIFGPTRSGQALVLIGLLLLMVGGLAWAYGRARRAPALLAALSSAAALTLLGDTWAVDGYGWAMRLAFVAGSVLFPVAWAAFFLSFPRDRLNVQRWRRLFAALVALALATLVAYALYFLTALPYAMVRALGAPVVLVGLALGLAALCLPGRHERAQARQQRRIVLLSAATAMLPALLLSFIPLVLLGHPLMPFEMSALAVVALPLGLAYAIVRYDLMALDVVVRRLVAMALGGLLLIGLTVVAALPLQPVVPDANVFSLIIAVLAGALGGRYVSSWAQGMAERLLSPELMQSRRVLAGVDPVVLTGTEELPRLAARLEAAACAVSSAPWARLLVRRRVPGAIFSLLHDGASPISLPLLTAGLARRPWGLALGEDRGPSAPAEWGALALALDDAPAVLIPLRMRGDVIAVLAVGERADDELLRGPDREALALLATHFALAVDHARVRAEVEAEGAEAAVFSAASADLAVALDDRAALPHRIVRALAALRDVHGIALLLYEPDGTPAIVARHGEEVVPEIPPDPAVATVTPARSPQAWLPLTVGGTAIGGLCVQWSKEHVIREHERRLLAVYASGAAMALEHARLYERARIQAERDPVTDLYNHRAFHNRLEAALERARTSGSQAGLLLIDLTDFKLFNDTHGHQAGDQALRRVGEVLQACCRTSDAAARLGGDEFAVLLPDADLQTARAIAERVTDLAAVSALISPEGAHLPVQLSIGVAAYPEDAGAANALLARADERMYEAKRTGVGVASVGRRDDRTEQGTDGNRFGILEALVAMVDNRDRYTGAHSEQVATYACALGAELGLSCETLDTLRLAGLLHDVGKIGVPDRVLRKPSRLTDEEVEIVRRHVELSEALLTVISQDRDLRDAVRHHHERWDGRGYPRGLASADVPLLGRIMIVADAVSAMGMDRPYRKGLPWECIAQELARGAGSQFDPALVPAALRALQPYIEPARAA